ncbi:MAG: GntR family transcriptional regulator [Bacteroidota bacterium]
MQIADQIFENILAGELEPGDRLQSVRELAANIQVNPNTVVRTFSYLQDQGIIFNQRGIGFFVSDDALTKTRNLKKETFIQQYIPELFKMMDLLNLSMDDLKKLYESTKKHRL